MFFEESAEIRGVFKADSEGDLVDRKIPHGEKVLGAMKKQIISVFQRCYAKFLAEKVVKTRGAEKAERSKLGAIDMIGWIFLKMSDGGHEALGVMVDIATLQT